MIWVLIIFGYTIILGRSKSKEEGRCSPDPILAPRQLEEYLRKGATMTRGIAPHITTFRGALRRAWVKSALAFALQEALRILNGEDIA